MKTFRFFYLLMVSVFMAVSFLVSPPAFAFTSLQSCYTNPACAKMLAEAGMIGGSTVPAGVATSSAGAASSIVAPNFGNALAVGYGIAALVWPWSQQQADELVENYIPPFAGGQSPGVIYNLTADFVSEFPPGSTPSVSSISDSGPGPLSLDSVDDPNGTFINLVDGNGQTLVVYKIDNDSQVANLENIVVTRADGQPDTGGDPPTPLSLDAGELPDEDFFGSPTLVPWPSPLPGPDGVLGTDDDVYPPLTIDGPYIGLGNGQALYNPSSEFNADNELAPGASPGSSPNPDGGDDIQVSVDFPALNPPPSQSSGCDGWGYGVCQLSDDFPFDIFGDMPTVVAPACPSFGFFGQSAEFCFITDLLGYIKWVVGISMVIYGVMVL